MQYSILSLEKQEATTLENHFSCEQNKETVENKRFTSLFGHSFSEFTTARSTEALKIAAQDQPSDFRIIRKTDIKTGLYFSPIGTVEESIKRENTWEISAINPWSGEPLYFCSSIKTSKTNKL